MKKILLAVAVTLSATAFVSCDKSSKASLNDDVDSLSYMIGVANGSQMKQFLADRSDLTMSVICEDHNGNVYVGTNAGLYRQQGNQFVHVASTGTTSISALQCDHYGRILVGYDGKGIAIYDPQNNEVTDNPFFSMEVELVLSVSLLIAGNVLGSVPIRMVFIFSMLVIN